MKLVEHELNRAIWFGELTESGKQQLFGSNLIRAVVERYGFVEAPKTAAEFDPQHGIAFRHGYYNGHIIDRFQVYNNGVFAEGRLDTDIGEAFLADAVSWAKQDAGIQFTETGAGRIYMSQLVVESESIRLGEALSPLQKILSEISSTVSQKSAHDVPAQVSGFLLQSDPAAGAGWLYRFERRAARPFAEQRFFSSAPLKTVDHLKLLDRVEKLLSASSSA